jgi:hypothetical protein
LACRLLRTCVFPSWATCVPLTRLRPCPMRALRVINAWLHALCCCLCARAADDVAANDLCGPRG